MAPPHALGATASRRSDGHPTIALVNRREALPGEEIEGLAAALLDLGSGYEAALRAVLSMQRMLERVRRSGEVSPEAALLIQEMSRQCQGLVDGAASIERCLDTTGQRLALLRPGT